MLLDNVGIDFGSGDFGVTEEDLNSAQVTPSLEEMCRAGMSEEVRMKASGNPRGPSEVPEIFPCHLAAQRLSGPGREQEGRIPAVENHGTDFRDVGVDAIKCRRGDHDLAGFGTFALLDEDESAVGHDMLEPDPEGLADSQACRVDEFEEHSGASPGLASGPAGFQELMHLVHGQHLGECHAPGGPGQAPRRIVIDPSEPLEKRVESFQAGKPPGPGAGAIAGLRAMREKIDYLFGAAFGEGNFRLTVDEAGEEPKVVRIGRYCCGTHSATESKIIQVLSNEPAVSQLESKTSF